MSPVQLPAVFQVALPELGFQTRSAAAASPAKSPSKVATEMARMEGRRWGLGEEVFIECGIGGV